MKAHIGVLKQTAANFAFSAFLLSMFGWALLETQLFNVAAGFKTHLLVNACGLAVSAVALRRCRLWWSLFTETDALTDPSVPNRYRMRDITSCIALVTAGCALTLCAKTGSLTLFAICAGAFSLTPWSRVVFCRRHFVTSCMMLGAGAVSVFIVTKTPAAPLSFFLCAWFLWMYALIALLTTLTSERPASSQPRPIPAAELRSSQQAADFQLEKAKRDHALRKH